MESEQIRESIDLLSEPEVYRLRDIGPLRENKFPSDLFPVDLYGQGEVLELTKRVDDQLSLIDSFAKLRSVTEAIGTQVAILETNSTTYFELIEQKKDIEEAISEKKTIKTRIAELDEHLNEPVFKDHESWEKAKTFVDDLEHLLEEIEKNIPDKPYDNYVVPDPSEEAQEAANLRKIADAFSALIVKLRDLSEQEARVFNRESNKIKTRINTWWDDYKRAKDELENQLKKLGLQEVKHAYEERNTLREKLREIERDHEPALNQIKQKIVKANRERAKALAELKRLIDERSDIRTITAEDLNSKLPENIQIEIRQLGNDNSYFSLLNDDIYDGSGIRNRKRHMQTLVSTFSPKDLADIIRKEDEDALTEAGLTQDAVEKVLDISEQNSRLIEEVVLNDQPIIRLRRAGEKDFAQLDNLSLGEKCSAILSILLVSENRPLIIDEPEAELDYDFICNNVVGSMREVKGRRQILVCTHNPNIPVLGDAELVIKVSKVAGKTQCSIEHTGGFEHPDSLYYLKQLEGGEDALRRRSMKYQMS